MQAVAEVEQGRSETVREALVNNDKVYELYTV